MVAQQEAAAEEAEQAAEQTAVQAAAAAAEQVDAVRAAMRGEQAAAVAAAVAAARAEVLAEQVRVALSLVKVAQPPSPSPHLHHTFATPSPHLHSTHCMLTARFRRPYTGGGARGGRREAAGGAAGGEGEAVGAAGRGGAPEKREALNCNREIITEPRCAHAFHTSQHLRSPPSALVCLRLPSSDMSSQEAHATAMSTMAQEHATVLARVIEETTDKQVSCLIVCMRLCACALIGMSSYMVGFGRHRWRTSRRWRWRRWGA